MIVELISTGSELLLGRYGEHQCLLVSSGA